MTQQSGREKCNCATGGATAAQAPPLDDGVTKVLKAQVPQSYEASFNVRIVPGRSLEDAVKVRPHCRPRGPVQGWTIGTLAVSAELADTLAKADKTMVAWLAKDKANAQRFLVNPVAAMREAGLKLSRTDEKSLARASGAAKATHIVPPGISIAKVTAEAFPNGRVGSVGPSKPGGKADGFDCGPKRKG
jgi:hypothetical protein